MSGEEIKTCSHEGCERFIYAKKECRYHRYKEKRREYYLKNREIILRIRKKYQKGSKYKEYQKKYQRTDKNREYQKMYYRKNRKKRIVNIIKYQKSDKRKAYMKVYCRTEKNKSYRRNKYKIDTNFLIMMRLRNLLRLNFNRHTKTGKLMSSKKYGIEWKPIIEHLTKTLPPDFKDHPSNWHIDHIKPCSKFDLTDPEQVKRCFSADNLQWLTAEENIRKGGR